MAIFDVSQAWVILLPQDVPAARACGDELARCITLLRRQQALSLPPPLQADSRRAAPDESSPLILLNPGPEVKGRNGFSWRLGTERLEIYGDSGRGLCNGVYDFLGALGFRWPQPNREEAPPRAPSPAYALTKDRAHKAPADGAGRLKRLIVSKLRLTQGPEALVVWAARNQADALALPLLNHWPWRLKSDGKRRAFQNTLRTWAEQYALNIEAGGWELSSLLPWRYFLRRPGLFRMEGGRRTTRYNFCATNPETIKIVQKEAERFFLQHPGTELFHLWPDRGQEQRWCACPSCRAFSPAEQNRIAVNAAADVLAQINPHARISFYESANELVDIGVRRNMFALNHLPGEGEEFLEGAEFF
jgi:hypothetical protein